MVLEVAMIAKDAFGTSALFSLAWRVYICLT
jgi:hypothetical protein